MSSKAKAKDEAVVEAAPAVVAEAPVQVAVAAPASPARRVSFEQWAAKRSIKDNHKRGMRAFVKNPDRLRTIADWDEAFKAY